MSAVTATRSELLQRRAQTAFAEQGRDLILDKRTALIREFAALRRDLLSDLDDVVRLAVRAREALRAAVATDGLIAVSAAALGSADRVEIELTSRSVAGVPIFELARSSARHDPRHRGWATDAVSTQVDAVAEAWELLGMFPAAVLTRASPAQLAQHHRHTPEHAPGTEAPPQPASRHPEPRGPASPSTTT